MHVRLTTITGVTQLDAGIAHLREKVVPELTQMTGHRGLTASADRSEGTVGVLGLWENEAALEASDSAVSKVRAEAATVFGGSVSVETFEEVLLETASLPPAEGCALIVRQTNVDPARVDEGLDFIRGFVSMVKETAGFRSMRVLVNRQSGDTIIGAVFDDQAALAAARERLEPPIFEQADSRNFQPGDASVRDLIFIHIP
jgi:hypothetical protein